MGKKVIQNITARLERLEKVVFGHKAHAVQKEQRGLKGPKGGILLLISRKFMDKSRTAQEVREELKKKRYSYRIQVVQTALNRLSIKIGPLTAALEGGKKVYVKRK